MQNSLREVDSDVVFLESVLGEESSARGVGFLDGHGFAEESVVNRIFEGLVGHANAIGVLKRVALDVSSVLEVDELILVEDGGDLLDGRSYAHRRGELVRSENGSCVLGLVANSVDVVGDIGENAVDSNPEDGDQVGVSIGDEARDPGGITNPIGHLMANDVSVLEDVVEEPRLIGGG